MMNKQRGPAVQLQSRSQFALIEDKREGEVADSGGGSLIGYDLWYVKNFESRTHFLYNLKQYDGYLPQAFYRHYTVSGLQ
jgi:hypothetical protein